MCYDYFTWKLLNMNLEEGTNGESECIERGTCVILLYSFPVMLLPRRRAVSLVQLLRGVSHYRQARQTRWRQISIVTLRPGQD